MMNTLTAAAIEVLTEANKPAIEALTAAVKKFELELVASHGIKKAIESNKIAEPKGLQIFKPYFLALIAAQKALEEAVDDLHTSLTASLADATADANAVRAARGYAPLKKARYSMKHRCNAACLTARGPVCVCGCAGANHGVGYVA